MPDQTPVPGRSRFFSPRRLAVARTAWLALAALIVVLFATGLAVYFRHVQTPCQAAPCYASPTPEQVRVLQAAGLSLGLFAAVKVAVVGLNAAVHAAMAAIIFWRLPADRMAWFTALTLLTFGTFGVHEVIYLDGVLAGLHPWWRVPAYALYLVGGTSIGLFYFVFPDGRFTPRWLRWLAAGWVLLQAVNLFFPGTWLDYAQWPLPGILLYWGLFFAILLSAQVFRYRRVSTAVQRQQTKWAVFGMGLALIGALGAFVLTALGPAFGPQWAPLVLFQDVSYYPFLLLMPLSIGVAILRSRLYDIDVVINRALVYSALTALLTLAYFSSVIVLQSASAVLTGNRQSALITVLSTLLIATLFVPLRRRVQGAIDRRFYRHNYDAARTLARFAASARDETDLGRLSEQLVGVVQETMQPRDVSLWLRAGGSVRTANLPPRPVL